MTELKNIVNQLDDIYRIIYFIDFNKKQKKLLLSLIDKLQNELEKANR